MAVRKDVLLVRDKGQPFRGSRIAADVIVGVLLGCALVFLYPHDLFTAAPGVRAASVLDLQFGSSSCESPERVNLLKSDIASLYKKNKVLRNQIRVLNERLRSAER